MADEIKENDTNLTGDIKNTSDFDKQLEDLKNGNLPDSHVFNLGKPSIILQNCGFPPNDRIELAASRLRLKAGQGNHLFDIMDITGLDKALHTPVAVFEYGDMAKSQNIIVNLKKDDKNFLVGVFFNQHQRGYEVSDIRGLFNRDNIDWLRWIQQGKMIYGNKDEIQVLAAQQRTNLAEVNSKEARTSSDSYYLDSVDNILHKFGDVKDIYTIDFPEYKEQKERFNIFKQFRTAYLENDSINVYDAVREADEFYDALKANNKSILEKYTDGIEKPELSNAATDILNKANLEKSSQVKEKDKSQEMHDTMYHTNSWYADFPSVFSNALYKELKRDDNLENLRLKAKAGDRDAADELVHEIADYEMIRNLKETFPDAIVAPVIAEEASGNNQVPYAYANLLRENGFEIDTNIIQSVRSHHTGANSIKRFTNRVRFDGEVQKGKSYILVDDHIDYGGTLRDFKDYIEANGGKVLAFSTLTAIDKDIKICPTKENIEKLNNYGDKVDELLKQFGITDNKNGLTNGEVEGLINLLSDKNRNREFESEDQRRFCILCKEIADAYQSKIKQEERTKPVLNRFLKLTSNLTIEEQKNLSDKINKISEAIKSENHDVIRLVQSFNKLEYSKKSPNFSQDILNADIKNLLITSSIALIDIKETEKGKENLNENTGKSKTFDSNSSIILGKTILPSFAVIADETLHSVENAVVKAYDKEKKSYLVDNGTEKLELPKATFDTLFNDKLDKDRTEAKIAEGRTIVFRNKEMGIQGTVIPEFAMYTQKGLETFKDCVPVQYNKSENTYTISNEKTSITISAEQFREITSPERFENKFAENTPAWKKLCEQQYKDFFQQRDNTAYNFRHNLSVYCRKEASSPCDALHLAKEIISRMSTEEQKQTKKLLKSMAHEGESTNELIARVYHEAIKGQPLNEDYIKKYEPNSFIKRPFYDTVSENGQKIEDDPTLIRGETDRNLKIGMSIKNVNIETDKLFGKGKNALHFDSLKVISASKETNTITLMDSNKSYFKLPRDTVLAHYKEQQIKEMKIEQRHNRNNSINLSYS